MNNKGYVYRYSQYSFTHRSTRLTYTQRLKLDYSRQLYKDYISNHITIVVLCTRAEIIDY